MQTSHNRRFVVGEAARAEAGSARFQCHYLLRLQAVVTGTLLLAFGTAQVFAGEISAQAETVKWRHAEIAGFEILSSRPDEITLRWVRGLQRELQLFQHFFPGGFLQPTEVPVQIILYSAASDVLHGPIYPSRSGRDSLVGTGFLPALNLTAAPPSTPAGPAKNAGRSAHVINFGSDQRFGGIQSFTDDDALIMTRNLRDEEAVGLLATPNAEFAMAGGMAFPLYVKHLSQYRTPPWPTWLSVAFSEFCGSLVFRANGIQLSLARMIRTLPSPISADSLLPMEKIFESDASALGLFQARLFLVWGMFADQGAHLAAFGKFVERACRESVTEPIFQACFGLDFAQMRQRLAAEIPPGGALQKRWVLQDDGLPAPPAFEMRDATTAQFARITGEATRLYARQPQRPGPSGESSSEYYATEAQATRRRGYGAGDRDPRLLAALGLGECDAGRAEKGRAFLEEAAKGKVVRPRVYLELARLRYREALANPQGADGKLGPDQVAFAVEPLALARLQTPRLPQLDELFIEVWSHAAIKPGPTDLAPIEEALRAYPRDTTLGDKAARLYASCGLNSEARDVVERCLSFRPEDAVRARLENLRAELK
jgi:hypothetical protein